MVENGKDPGRRSRYAPSQSVRLHRRQLFHWIGSDLVERGEINDEIRQEYVSYLRDSLDRGLWLKCPRQQERLLDGLHFEVKKPICCFTETSLDEIKDHSRKYGRLGLGFPKRFVLERGGRPVNYLLGQRNDEYMLAWHRLAKILGTPDVLGSLSDKKKSDVKESLSFVSHFLKEMKQPSEKRSTPRKQTEPNRAERTHKSIPDPYQRSFGGPLHFLEEREWRFVLGCTRNKTIPRGALKNDENIGSSDPSWFVPYEPGKDLFTVVFPDNATLAKAIMDNEVRAKLFRNNSPHVTLLTLDDLGTF